MSKTPGIDFIRRRFAQLVAPAMGWRTEPFYKNGSPQYGNVQIEKVFGGRYRVTQLCQGSTGERNLSEAFTKRELSVWMDGVLLGAQTFGKDQRRL